MVNVVNGYQSDDSSIIHFFAPILTTQLFMQPENDQDLPRAARWAIGLPQGLPHGSGRDMRRVGPLLLAPRGRYREASPARLGQHDVGRRGLREANRGHHQGHFVIVRLVTHVLIVLGVQAAFMG